MYYDYSFCSDITPYIKELNLLDSIISSREFNVIGAKSCAFTFSLLKNRKANLFFDHDKYFLMYAAFSTQKSEFLQSVNCFDSFDKQMLDFCVTNYSEKSPWNTAIYFYLMNYFSIPLDSSDGPWYDNLDFIKLKKHLISLSLFSESKIECFYKENKKNNFINVYEFPIEDKFEKDSIIITHKHYDDLELIFEDKLKIYGV